MPDIHSITIERKPNQRLEPHGDFRQKIRHGAQVQFLLAAPLTGLIVHFSDRTPFAVSTINYGESPQITAQFDAQHPDNNVYKFDCTDPNAAPGQGPSINGGEVEIIPSLAG